VRKAVTLRVGDREFLLANWAKITGVHRNTLYARIKAGWTPEEVIGEKDRPQPQPKDRGPKGPAKIRPNNLTQAVEIHYVSKTVTKVVPDNKAIGQAAREVRKLAGLSLAQASVTLGMTLMKLWEMESGRTKWKQKDIDKFNQISKGWVKHD